MPEQDHQPRISLQEKERRWSLLRGRLQQADLAAIIVYGGSQLGVPVHYLTNVWGTRMNMLIFPAQGEPVFLIPSNSIDSAADVARQGCWVKEESIVLAPHTARYGDG